MAAKRRMVLTRTVDKWIAENDRTLSTTTWLTYERLNRECVQCLKWSVCIRFRDKLVTCRNYNSAFIEGSNNLRSSAFKDHARSDMHQREMLLLKKVSAKDITHYAPIARAFSSIDSPTEERVKKQFEIAYMLCKENMSFSKMSAICELEQHHGVDLGQSYKSRQACTSFVEYIALAQRQQLASLLDKAKFFSIQADGSTDAANIEQELCCPVL